MFPFFRRRNKAHKSHRKTTSRRRTFERLEDRTVLSTFSVMNLGDHGAGSLRQAMLDANSHAGADIIDFDVAGVIQLTSGALPTISGQVNIAGSTAPGFAGAPLVEIDFNHFDGLVFNSKSEGSQLDALSLVNASGDALTLKGGHDTILGNYIGLELNGSTAAANQGNGITISGAGHNIVGGDTAQDRNVVSANLGNGIEISSSSHNTVMGNYIGTDTTGLVDLGNAGSGILLTHGASDNLIGGEATGGNDPTASPPVFVVPPQGNLISANGGDGVLINKQSTGNQLSGNFIGTNATGDAALGNSLNGVDIENANGNSLIGCTFTDSPFVFYNVVSGNGGNGIVVNNSNHTTIQANFIGLGADNATALGNAQNGVLVEGDSSHTTMGGPIPLGNVDAANGANGILVQDQASFFTSYNTFDGVAAFSEATTLGNGGDGMLITSTGGHNLIRTNVVSRNHLSGIELAGQATGVDIVGNIVGLDWNGLTNMGNARDGILVGGNAHGDIIGGPQPTFNVIAQNVMSGNGWYGVDVEGTAHNLVINHSYLGTDITGTTAIGNAYGIVVAGNTSHIAIGSTDSSLRTVISGNNASGVLFLSGRKNSIVGSYIGVDATGQVAMGNGAAGVYIVNSSNNTIGGKKTGAGNIIAHNNSQGVLVQGGTGNGILRNSIYGNGDVGILLLTGANNNQAAPVLTSVNRLPNSIRVTGTLTSTPEKNFTIEFFASDASGANGRVFLGSMKVRTHSNGVATFTFLGPLPPAGDNFITATATDSHDNTSDFSNDVS